MQFNVRTLMLGVAVVVASGCAGTDPATLELDTTSVETPVGVDANINFSITGEADNRTYVLADTSIARVWATETGIALVGLAPGSTSIQVEDNGLWGTVRVAVTPPVYKENYLDPAALDLVVDGEADIACVAVYTDTTAFDVSSDCNWTSESPDIATFENGKVKAHKAGTAKLHAGYNKTEFVADIVVRDAR